MLIACLGYAASLMERLRYHRDVLQSLIQIWDLLAGEIRYERLTMAEAFRNLDRKYHGVAGGIMRRISERLAEADDVDLETVWADVFRKEQKTLMLSPEELDILLDTGKTLGYLDVEAQVSRLNYFRGRLEKKFQEAEKEIHEKRKLYRYIAVAVGVMIVLMAV